MSQPIDHTSLLDAARKSAGELVGDLELRRRDMEAIALSTGREKVDQALAAARNVLAAIDESRVSADSGDS